MKDFQDKVAVVTGAASGIGRALAGKSAQEGMKVVLADVEENALSSRTQPQNSLCKCAWKIFSRSGCPRTLSC